jgi:hypothetical protein
MEPGEGDFFYFRLSPQRLFEDMVPNGSPFSMTLHRPGNWIQAHNFMERLMDPTPATRMTIQEALDDPFLLEVDGMKLPPISSRRLSEQVSLRGLWPEKLPKNKGKDRAEK